MLLVFLMTCVSLLPRHRNASCLFISTNLHCFFILETLFVVVLQWPLLRLGVLISICMVSCFFLSLKEILLKLSILFFFRFEATAIYKKFVMFAFGFSNSRLDL